MLQSIKGQTAIITGASSGFGKATAIALAREGVNVILSARNSKKLATVAQECQKYNVQAYYYAGDITKEETSVEIVKLALQKLGKIDILVANAGLGIARAFLKTPLSDYDTLMNTNMRGYYAICYHVLPQMIKQHSGQIIITASVTALDGHAGEVAYSATKFANRGFAQALNKEFRKDGIKVCCMDPSAADTHFEMGNGRTQEGNKSRSMLTGEDYADAVVFVCKQRKDIRVMEMRLAPMSGD